MRFATRLVGLLTVALVAACGGEYPQSSIDPATDFAETIHALYTSIFWWTVLILVVVWAVLAYILVRFRERPDSPEPKQVHGHLGLEIGWTIGPALIVVAIAIPTIQAVFATQQGDPENAMVVEVVGHQFWWEFRYPDTGVVTANELHLPVGRPVSLRLHSADVIHSFWVPQLGGKRDVNPLVARPEGVNPNYNWIHFTANETGTFMGQCAEFCGDSHSLMGMRVIVHEPDEFEAWVSDWQAAGAEAGARQADAQQADAQAGDTATAQQAGDTATAQQAAAPGDESLDVAFAPPAQEDPLVEQGRQIFHGSTCVACHAIAGTNAQGEIAPNLTLMGRRSTLGAGWLENTPENLERWITAPRSIKPGVLMPGVAEPGGDWPATNLSEDQVRAVAAYLSSLR